MSLPAANFHELYQKYSREVYRFALYLSGDAARAEDLTAEAFLRIWAAPAPAHLATVKSYLFAIVRNLNTEHWRSARRETVLPDDIAAHLPIDRAIDARAEFDRVTQALQALQPLERAAVLLRGEHGLAYEEIARILDITPVAARVKVHRARKELLQARKGVTNP